MRRDFLLMSDSNLTSLNAALTHLLKMLHPHSADNKVESPFTKNPHVLDTILESSNGAHLFGWIVNIPIILKTRGYVE